MAFDAVKLNIRYIECYSLLKACFLSVCWFRVDSEYHAALLKLELGTWRKRTSAGHAGLSTRTDKFITLHANCSEEINTALFTVSQLPSMLLTKKQHIYLCIYFSLCISVAQKVYTSFKSGRSLSLDLYLFATFCLNLSIWFQVRMKKYLTLLYSKFMFCDFHCECVYLLHSFYCLKKSGPLRN